MLRFLDRAQHRRERLRAIVKQGDAVALYRALEPALGAEVMSQSSVGLHRAPSPEVREERIARTLPRIAYA